MSEMQIEVRTQGPVFDGTAVAEVDDFVEETTEEVAQLGVNEVRARLGQVLMHPTGFYESQIRTDRVRSDAFVVTDGGIIYGPWLEGVSRRNQSTRFKGYSTFRRTRDRLDAMAGPLAEQRLSGLVGRWNS